MHLPHLIDPQRPSIRRFNYVDYKSFRTVTNSSNYALRDTRYKYLMNDGVEVFSELNSDAVESGNLLDGTLSDYMRRSLAEIKAQIPEMRSDL